MIGDDGLGCFDRWAVQFLDKYTRRDLSSSRSEFGKHICPYVIISYDMMDFQPSKFVLQFANFCHVVIHPFVVVIPFLVDLLDD